MQISWWSVGSSFLRIVASCGLVVEIQIHLTAKIEKNTPLPTSTKIQPIFCGTKGSKCQSPKDDPPCHSFPMKGGERLGQSKSCYHRAISPENPQGVTRRFNGRSFSGMPGVESCQCQESDKRSSFQHLAARSQCTHCPGGRNPCRTVQKPNGFRFDSHCKYQETLVSHSANRINSIRSIRQP